MPHAAECARSTASWSKACKPNDTGRRRGVNLYFKTSTLLLIIKLFPPICVTQDIGRGVNWYYKTSTLYWQLNCIQPNVQQRALTEVNWHFKTSTLLLIFKMCPNICTTQCTCRGVNWYYKTGTLLLTIKLYPTKCTTQGTGWGQLVL